MSSITPTELPAMITRLSEKMLQNQNLILISKISKLTMWLHTQSFYHLLQHS